MIKYIVGIVIVSVLLIFGYVAVRSNSDGDVAQGYIDDSNIVSETNDSSDTLVEEENDEAPKRSKTVSGQKEEGRIVYRNSQMGILVSHLSSWKLGGDSDITTVENSAGEAVLMISLDQSGMFTLESSSQQLSNLISLKVDGYPAVKGTDPSGQLTMYIIDVNGRLFYITQGINLSTQDSLEASKIIYSLKFL